MKLLSVQDIRNAEKHTMEKQRITSLELMERAAIRCAEWISSRFARTTSLCFICGPGNNGGDGVALARIMQSQGYACTMVLVNEGDKMSEDLRTNLDRLPEKVAVFRNEWSSCIEQSDVLIDALFGTGISRKAEGIFREAIEAMNASPAYVLSIDLPSGLLEFPEKPGTKDAVIQASHTLTFQVPKLAFMFSSVYKYCGSFTVLDIGLDREFMESTGSRFHYITRDEVKKMLPVRGKFDHKGNHGHGLLIAGSFGKAGAAILSGSAALHTGAGLITVASPECNHIPLQTAIPEAMYERSGDLHPDGYPQPGIYDAIAAGPGIGTADGTVNTIKSLIQNSPVPLILDADALNIISDNKTWLAFLPAFSILTPHPKELTRLTEKTEDDFQLLEKAKDLAKKHVAIVILKGAHTAICSPDGNVYFNSTGNPGLAKGGSGDALTGIILGLMCQGLPPLNAAIAGVYVHGLAGDICLESTSEEAMVTRDVIQHLGKAFTSLKS